MHLSPGTPRHTRRALGAAVVALLTVAVAGSAAGTSSAAPARADNPYAGASVHVDPEWSARAASVPGGEAVADQPTAVWLNSIAQVHDPAGQAGRTMGLADHLDAALAQDADLVQIVLHNLPGRSCAHPARRGELAANQLDAYRTEYVDPIVEILGDPAYADLRIVTVVEPNSLTNLILHVPPRPSATPECQATLASGVYVAGVSYALDRLGALPNVYTYLDATGHGQLGWTDNFAPAARLFHDTATTGGATPDDVDGFVVNTADYDALEEPYLDRDDVVRGQPVYQSRSMSVNPASGSVPRPMSEMTRSRRSRARYSSAAAPSRTMITLAPISRRAWASPSTAATSSATGSPSTSRPWSTTRTRRCEGRAAGIRAAVDATMSGHRLAPPAHQPSEWGEPGTAGWHRACASRDFTQRSDHGGGSSCRLPYLIVSSSRSSTP